MTPFIHHFRDGDIIYREGETSDSAFLVDQGVVELVKMGRGGPQVVLTFGKGELFGETGVLDKGPRSGTARAKGAVVVREIPRDDFLKAIQADPSAALKVMTRMAKRIRDTDDKLVQEPRGMVAQDIASVPGRSLVPVAPMNARGGDLRPDAIIGKPVRYGPLTLALAWFRRRRATQATIQRRAKVVVVTPLSTEAEFDQRPFFMEALGGIPGFVIKATSKPLAGDDGTNRNSSRLKQAARQLMIDEKADLLIWGGEDASGRLLELRFAPANIPATERLGAFPSDARLVIPADFNEDWHPLLQAVMMAAMGDSGDPLLSLVADARPLGLSPPGALGAAGQASVSLAYAFAALLAGFARRRPDLTTLASNALKMVIPKLPRDAVGERLAAHKAVALLLENEADKTGTVDTLVQAVSAFRGAIECIDKDNEPRAWAFLHTRLGGSLFRLDLKTSEEGVLKEAIGCYQLALQIYTRNELPWRWAETMNALGQALQVFGDLYRSEAVLEKAIDILRAAAEVRTAEGAPLLYAATRNNIGSAHFLIAKHTGDPDHMRLAALAFRDALSVHRSAGGIGALSRIISSNLERAEELLRRSGVKTVVEPAWATEEPPELVLPDDLEEETDAFLPSARSSNKDTVADDLPWSMPDTADQPMPMSAPLGGVNQADRLPQRRSIET